MVSIDELKAKFGPAVNVAPYGECLVIPGTEFDPDWEVSLGDKGYTCHFTDYEGKTVTLVQLKKAVAEGKVVYVPPAVSKIVHGNVEVKEVEKIVEAKKEVAEKPAPGTSSTVADDFIVELWEAHVTYDGIDKAVQEKFPNEHISTEYRLLKLKDAGRITSRHRKELPKQNRGNPRPKMPWLKDSEFWSPEEDALIIELWKKGISLAEISVEVNKKYPKRVGRAVIARVYQLQGKGSIEKRHKPKLKAAKSPETTDAEKSEKSTEATPECKPDLELALANLTIEINQQYKTFKESLLTLNDDIIQLKADFEKQMAFIHPNLVEINETIGNLKADLPKHKHAVSGEAMLPMEA